MNNWNKVLGLILGVWLLTAPHTFGYQSTALIWSDSICGILLILMGPIFPLCTYGIVAFWLGLAPLVLWSPDAASYLNDTLVSVILFGSFIPLSGAFKSAPTSPAIPPKWSYNPSTWPQRLPVALLAFICWMISRYLAAYQLGHINAVWDPFFEHGTVDVLTSDVSKAFPVSDAGLGAFAYTLEMLSAFFGNERRWRTMPWMVLIFGVLSVPVSLVSVILIILQPLVVGAWCTLCLVTAFCMLIAIPLAINEVIATLHFLRGNWKALFRGGECAGAKIDPMPPAMNGSMFNVLRLVRRGITTPWNLVGSSLLGASLMVAPGFFQFDGLVADLDHIFGALIVVASVIAFADIVRYVRLANVVFALPVLVTQFFITDRLFFHAGLATLVVLFSLYHRKKNKSARNISV